MLEKRVIEHEQTQRDREQIEEAIVSGRSDRDLEKDQEPGRNLPKPARRPDEKRRDDLDDKAERDGKFLEPFRMLVRPPTERGRQWLRPVMIIERGQVQPA